MGWGRETFLPSLLLVALLPPTDILGWSSGGTMDCENRLLPPCCWSPTTSGLLLTLPGGVPSEEADGHGC